MTEIQELAAALAKAQATIQSAHKSATNPHFRSKYADLASIWDACRGPLTENGLSVVQCPGFNAADNLVTMKTILIHASGQAIASTLSAPIEKSSPQAIGSAITYLRRYALAAMVGVAPDDDDGEAASQPTRAEPAKRSPKSTGPTQKQVEFLLKLVQSSVVTSDERTQVEGWLEAQPTGKKVSEAIDHWSNIVKTRKTKRESVDPKTYAEKPAAVVAEEQAADDELPF